MFHLLKHQRRIYFEAETNNNAKKEKKDQNVALLLLCFL